MGFTQIAARILQGTVHEYKDLSLEEVENCILGENTHVATEPVHPEIYQQKIVHVCLGGKEIDNELIGFLNVLFRWGGDREERKTVLKDEYGLKLSREVEKEWNKVMTYEGVWTKQIKEEGREEGIVYATNLLLSTGMST